jgi:glycine cleavage system aminomethyltransferase T
MEAGRAHNIRPTGPSDIRRIEAGILNWGADMTLDNNVYELGLEYLVDNDKSAPYIGRDALARIRSEGVERKLVGIEIEGGRIDMNAVPWAVTRGGTAIGRVTSAIWSPRLEKNIGFAMVPAGYATVGKKISVVIPGGEDRAAMVVPRPFVDPDKALPKQ